MNVTSTAMPKSNHKRISRPAFHRLKSLSVIGGYLDGQSFEFSAGLNCLIGARGTGKTTALEFVRYALDMLPSREENPVERRRIESLVERNLDGGRIQVGIQTKDGLAYMVSRSWGEEPIVLGADGAPTAVTLRSGGIFKADIFSQNEVEGIADRGISQLSLIDNFEVAKIAAIEAELHEVRSALDANAKRIEPLQARFDGIREDLHTLPDVEERLKAFSAGDGQDVVEVNRAHACKALRDREQRAVADAGRSLDALSRDLGAAKGRLSREATISAQMLGEEKVQIVVEDTGMGIAAEDLEEILQFIPGKSSKRGYGTGFGLPIAQRNIELHGGSMGIESQEDQGTRVTMVLPVKQNGEEIEWDTKHSLSMTIQGPWR